MFGLFTIFTLLMVVLGNLFAFWKIYTRALQHTEKCGCCGQAKKEEVKKEEPKKEDPKAMGILEEAKDLSQKISKF
jgi:formate dehydrogenase assembly factor FdhD